MCNTLSFRECLFGLFVIHRWRSRFAKAKGDMQGMKDVVLAVGEHSNPKCPEGQHPFQEKSDSLRPKTTGEVRLPSCNATWRNARSEVEEVHQNGMLFSTLKLKSTNAMPRIEAWH
ncbi:hypothetical protein Rcae01_06476 [Novipirellula caenicola]|uniref:Uncharacterized protein n=1 Tax=Novipirellula caenicola TaxID=1536901 RepID=A0ABP9W0R6_9BACT